MQHRDNGYGAVDRDRGRTKLKKSVIKINNNGVRRECTEGSDADGKNDEQQVDSLYGWSPSCERNNAKELYKGAVRQQVCLAG